MFHALLGRCQPRVTGRRKFRVKNKPVSLDPTVIDLCATVFNGAKFCRTKGAVKLHCLFAHDVYLPSVVVITDGKRHDHWILERLERNDLEALQHLFTFDSDAMRSGTGEARAWISVAAAMNRPATRVDDIPAHCTQTGCGFVYWPM